MSHDLIIRSSPQTLLKLTGLAWHDRPSHKQVGEKDAGEPRETLLNRMTLPQPHDAFAAGEAFALCAVFFLQVRSHSPPGERD